MGKPSPHLQGQFYTLQNHLKCDNVIQSQNKRMWDISATSDNIPHYFLSKRLHVHVLASRTRNQPRRSLDVLVNEVLPRSLSVAKLQLGSMLCQETHRRQQLLVYVQFAWELQDLRASGEAEGPLTRVVWRMEPLQGAIIICYDISLHITVHHHIIPYTIIYNPI